MKKLSVLVSFLCIFASLDISTRCVNITTIDGSTLYIDDNTTVAQLFRECRNNGFCENSKKLVLYFGSYEIIENSEASNRPLWYFGNQVEYASISYYNQSNYNNDYSYDYQNRTISVRASNGMIRTCKATQTPAHFFRSCRSAGNCSSTAPMKLKFGTYEIKENSPAANKCFYEFNTDATYAYVMYWDNDVNLDDVQAGALVGTALCGVGFLYFLSLLNS
jgi:hypothetical protein